MYLILYVDSNRRKSLQIVCDRLDKIIEKVQKMEKEPSEQPNQVKNLVEPQQKTQKITLNLVEKKILDIADRLEKLSTLVKKKSKQTQKSKSAGVTAEKIEIPITHLLEKDSVQTEIPSESFEIISPPETVSVNNQAEPISYNYQTESLSSQITTLYNRGINERSDRDLFWERFSITRIGNANSVAQRLGEVSAPDFREAGNGDFLAIESDNQSYFVVPLFDTTITPSAFNEGGISYAFDCGNYDLQTARSILRINKAAIFRREGEKWFLVEGRKGELVLQT